MAARDGKIQIKVFGVAGEPLSAPASNSRVDVSVLRLARLIGRQMAREQFERQQESHGSSGRKKREPT
ncbi:hypothetical protein GALL_244630 [mine drainage metagenome]|uniref:Uncharacterized protein n=1 Tax=mine drainage metagenome TaxID=410659 RepID=A0A1J5RNT0_9ZZZZ